MGTMGTGQYLQQVTAFPSLQNQWEQWEQMSPTAKRSLALFPLFPSGNSQWERAKPLNLLPCSHVPTRSHGENNNRKENMLKFAQKLSKLSAETLPLQVETATVAIQPLVMPTVAPVRTTMANDWAALYANHCKRCGTPLTDGCALCATPLPF